MSVLDKYLAAQAAEITAYDLTEAGAYEEIWAWPSSDFAWNLVTKAFAFWWAGDDKPHVFSINRVEDDDYQAVLYHEHGKLEVGPIWNTDQQDKLDRWATTKDAANIGRWLNSSIGTAETQAGLVAPGPTHSYQTMLELAAVPGSEPVRWVVVGAWAANQDEIAFWALPQFAGQGDEWALRINEALANGFKPLELLDYWWQAENGMTTSRPRGEDVAAVSAAAAAEFLARQMAAEF